jgi:hypothetical protein
MEWFDIPNGMTVYEVFGSPLDQETREPILVATDLGRMFLVVPEWEPPELIRYQIYMAGWWLEPSEGKPVKWAKVPMPPMAARKAAEAKVTSPPAGAGKA